MRALLVYESMFGNTRAVAEAVAEGLSTRMTVDVVEVGAAGSRSPGDVDLLVVAGPTHALGLSRPQTRLQAEEKSTAPLVSAGSGLREWLAAAPRTDGLPAAAFDTRVKAPLPGSAARAAARRLRRGGCRLVSRPVSFYVAGTAGPLLDGELDRAREWGRQVASATARAVAGHPAAERRDRAQEQAGPTDAGRPGPSGMPPAGRAGREQRQ